MGHFKKERKEWYASRLVKDIVRIKPAQVRVPPQKRRPWTKEEDDIVLAGLNVMQSWKEIASNLQMYEQNKQQQQHDPPNDPLRCRTNIDCKDRARNMLQRANSLALQNSLPPPPPSFPSFCCEITTHSLLI